MGTRRALERSKAMVAWSKKRFGGYLLPLVISVALLNGSVFTAATSFQAAPEDSQMQRALGNKEETKSEIKCLSDTNQIPLDAAGTSTAKSDSTGSGPTIGQIRVGIGATFIKTRKKVSPVIDNVGNTICTLVGKGKARLVDNLSNIDPNSK